ncbi:hypothetical protein D3C79_896700 [compost metagenome]
MSLREAKYFLVAVQAFDREGAQVIDLSFTPSSAQCVGSPLSRFEGIAKAYERLAIDELLDVIDAELSYGPIAQYQAPLSIVIRRKTGERETIAEGAFVGT